jgi:hypothetical protein
MCAPGEFHDRSPLRVHFKAYGAFRCNDAHIETAACTSMLQLIREIYKDAPECGCGGVEAVSLPLKNLSTCALRAGLFQAANDIEESFDFLKLPLQPWHAHLLRGLFRAPASAFQGVFFVVARTPVKQG